jgi:membrane protease YdiL (CAAX protease family)
MNEAPRIGTTSPIAMIFLDRHRDLRSGWRIVLFVVMVGAAGFVLQMTVPAAVLSNPIAGALLAVSLVMLVSWVMMRFLNHKALSAIGLWFHDSTFRELGLGMLLGFVMMSGIVMVELAMGYIHVVWRGLTLTEAASVVAVSGVAFALAACAEELVFRGYAFQTMMQMITFAPAVGVMSLLFGIGHLFNPHATLLGTANVVLAGIWLSFAYLKTRGLWLPFGLHFAWNFSQTTIYAFPTSGLALEDRTLWTLEQTGPEWITGGAFGPEGGVLATIALLLGTWYILKSRQLAAQEGIITLDSPEDLLPPAHNEEGVVR